MVNGIHQTLKRSYRSTNNIEHFAPRDFSFAVDRLKDEFGIEDIEDMECGQCVDVPDDGYICLRDVLAHLADAIIEVTPDTIGITSCERGGSGETEDVISEALTTANMPDAIREVIKTAMDSTMATQLCDLLTHKVYSGGQIAENARDIITEWLCSSLFL